MRGLLDQLQVLFKPISRRREVKRRVCTVKREVREFWVEWGGSVWSWRKQLVQNVSGCVWPSATLVSIVSIKRAQVFPDYLLCDHSPKPKLFCEPSVMQWFCMFIWTGACKGMSCCLSWLLTLFLGSLKFACGITVSTAGHFYETF